MPKILAPTPTLSKGIRSMTILNERKLSEQWKIQREKKKAQQCRNYSGEKLMAFPFPGQLPCRHAAPLSHTFPCMLHCPYMFDVLHKERERIDTNISCKQAIDAYWQPDPNRIQSFDMFVCEWYLTWQVLSERSLREVLFLCLGPWKSEILIQSVLKRAKPNKTISLMTLWWDFKKIAKSTEQNSVTICHLYCFTHNGNFGHF